MSRIGRMPVPIPSGVNVDVKGTLVQVKGPNGTLSERLPAPIEISVANSEVTFNRRDDKKTSRALHGLARALVANMVKGVTDQFSKELEIQGVGYRAEARGKTLVLNVGYSHTVELSIPDSLKVSVDRNVIIKVEGASRQRVGQFAADIRSVRPPEPYKGKGIRYLGEHIRRKVGKAGAAGGAG